MNNNNNIDKIKYLEREIIKHKDLYYKGAPEISDYEYDKIEQSLKSIDPENEILDVVGSKLIFNSEKVEHENKMLSLNKTYNLESLLQWSDDKEVVSTFKIDGSSCSLIYDKGKLVIAKTRGDGSFGENITNKILYIDDIPKKILDNNKIEFRGEIYCSRSSFTKLSKKMITMNLDAPTSQRNIVAGLLGRKENIGLNQYLNFQAFEIIFEKNEFKSELEKFKYIKQQGFKTPKVELVKSRNEFEKQLDSTRDFLTSGEYLIDGMVFSFNNLDLHKRLGETAHHPRYKMAFKFQGETKVSCIQSISWQVSRNGILTPVANIKSVELSGAIVSRVTLHNFGIVESNQLKVGDEIEIVRSGEVIPKFLSVTRVSKECFLYPLTCPSCGEETKIEEIRLLCNNKECPERIKDEILNFIKKIGIEDLSSKRLEEMIKLGFIKTIPDLYSLTEDQLLSMDKFKQKLADKILKSITESMKANLLMFISALGITGGAQNKCEKVVNSGFNTIDKIMSLTTQDLINIDSFAEKSATDFVDSLGSKKKIIEKLISYGFRPKYKLASVKDSAITGKRFCITGTLSLKRSDLQRMVKENGGIVQSGVNKDTDYLITNDTESNSSKFIKAKNQNTPILSEEEFFKLIG